MELVVWYLIYLVYLCRRKLKNERYINLRNRIELWWDFSFYSKNGREVLSNVINSQIKIHEQFGGVVPEIASRNHIEAISNVVKEAIKQANITMNDIDVIACTYGPGLVGALLVGVSYAKALSYSLNKPLVGTNHIHGHIAANYISHPELEPPFLCLVISGGHTHLVHIKAILSLKC